MSRRVPGRHTEPDSAARRRNGRGPNGRGINAMCKQMFGQAHRAADVSNKDGEDRGFAGERLAPQVLQSLVQAFTEAPQFGSALRFSLNELQRR